MSTLRGGALVAAGASALVFVASATAEIIARGVQDGTLAVAPNGQPAVAYVRGKRVLIAERVSPGKWRTAHAASVSHGSEVAALRVGARGPVAVTLSADARTLMLVRRTPQGWRATRLARRLPRRAAFGPPGLLLDPAGLPIVTYTRWNGSSWNTVLTLVRLDRRGRFHLTSITRAGFPQSYVPPPSAPVMVKGRIHVVESYGYKTVVGTIEWTPVRHTWEGIFIHVGRGEWPVGPLFAAGAANGNVYAAWSQSILAFGAIPVALAVRGRHEEARWNFLLNRGLTTALALASGRAEVAANEWVSDDPEDVFGHHPLWAGKVLSGKRRAELDGWISGLAADRRGRRNLLIARAGGLSWFRSPGRLGKRVSIKATEQQNGSVLVTGATRGVSSGSVTLYRERFGAGRQRIGRASIARGTFSFVDRSPTPAAVYRAVYVDPSTGIPYAGLLRKEAGSSRRRAARLRRTCCGHLITRKHQERGAPRGKPRFPFG